MFDPTQYELLDFGAGRKLERFGAEILDRPSPAADGTTVADPGRWGSATARFELTGGANGQWDDRSQLLDADEDPWSVRHGDSRLLMQLRPSGNVGLFPEQANNWTWIADEVGRWLTSGSAELSGTNAPRVLNLFAYTGAASLAAAAAGAEVTHVDSSGPTVSWARRNADLSGLADRPIRWLVEDAMKFVAKECRRGNHYDGIIADPPTYGHGPKGRPFKFGQHVGELMELCGQLLGADHQGHRFLLFSCHAPGFGIDDAESAVAAVIPEPRRGRLTSGPLALKSRDGRELSAGVCVRWSSSG